MGPGMQSPNNGMARQAQMAVLIKKRQEDIAFLNKIYAQDQQGLKDIISDNGFLKRQLDEVEKQHLEIKQKIE